MHVGYSSSTLSIFIYLFIYFKIDIIHEVHQQYKLWSH